jgi:hypothetical protein
MQKRMSAFDIRAKEDNNKGYAPGYFFPTHFYAPGFFFYHLGGGGNIHIFVFTDLKNNSFQNKLIRQNTNIKILPPPPIIEFATPL